MHITLDGLGSSGREHVHYLVYKHLGSTGKTEVNVSVLDACRQAAHDVGGERGEELILGYVLDNRLERRLLLLVRMLPVEVLGHGEKVCEDLESADALVGHIVRVLTDIYGDHLLVRYVTAKLGDKLKEGIVHNVVYNCIVCCKDIFVCFA